MLALQRDPDVFERGQMRKYRRDLERTDQPEPRHIGRRHRGDVLPLVEDPARRRLQELGQQIEAGRLAGPVRADQRVNAATADLEIDIANGEETREFLGQSVGFENELIGQTNFPLPLITATSRAALFFRTAGSPEDYPENRIEPPPPAGICRQWSGLGKAESWACGAHIGRMRQTANSSRLLKTIAACGRRCISTKILTNLSPSSLCFRRDSDEPWNSKAPNRRSSNRSSSGIS